MSTSTMEGELSLRASTMTWNDEDLPKSQWHLPDFLWFPRGGAVRDPTGRVSG